MKFILTILSCFLMLHLSHADTFVSGKKPNKVLVKGSTRLHDVKTNSVVVDGFLTFKNLDVKGDVIVTYPIREGSEKLKCRHLAAGKSICTNHLECESAHICGAAHLENVKISGDATINGEIRIKNGELNNLNSGSNEIHLENVKVNDIIIEAPRLSSMKQTIHLKNGTTVSGNIHCKSEKATIFMDKDVIVKGEINGATINKEGDDDSNEKEIAKN